MSLRLRLTLLLSVVITGTLLVAWGLTRRAVIAPFTQEVMTAHLDQVAYVAEEIEAGADPKDLGRKLGFTIRKHKHPPRFVKASRGGGRHRGLKCKTRVRRDRKIVICRGPRSPAAIKLGRGLGWVTVRRELDVDAPTERLGLIIGVLAIIIILLSAALAVRITRPLRATVDAMQHMAAGDLGHRLPQGRGPELKEVSLAFNAMADRLDKMLRAEKELMAGISHELRTPLARLRLQMELLRDQEVAPKRLDAMEQDIEEVDHLVGEALELSRLSLTAKASEDLQVDLQAVVDEAVLNHPLPEHEIIVQGEAAPLRGEHGRMVRVVGNLLQNAGKYAPSGTKVHVLISAGGLEVSDEGQGVPPEDLPRLFEPFYRGARGRRSSATGYGLGLMYARQVVELCGGTITAKPSKAGGLSIRVQLPPA